MEWQPIDTAPKDGTRILAYFPEEEDKILTIKWGYHRWGLCPDGGTEFEYEIIGKPTHWMPLPRPPVNNKGCNCPEIFKGPHGCTSCGDKSYLNNNEE